MKRIALIFAGLALCAGLHAAAVRELGDQLIGRSAADEARFIGHEFIIYLLKEALKNENAFRGFATWPATEGLAEFYLQRLLGPGWIHPDYAEYIALYEAMAPAPAADLYREALRQKEIENL